MVGPTARNGRLPRADDGGGRQIHANGPTPPRMDHPTLFAFCVVGLLYPANNLLGFLEGFPMIPVGKARTGP